MLVLLSLLYTHLPLTQEKSRCCPSWTTRHQNPSLTLISENIKFPLSCGTFAIDSIICGITLPSFWMDSCGAEMLVSSFTDGIYIPNILMINDKSRMALYFRPLWGIMTIGDILRFYHSANPNFPSISSQYNTSANPCWDFSSVSLWTCLIASGDSADIWGPHFTVTVISSGVQLLPTSTGHQISAYFISNSPSGCCKALFLGCIRLDNVPSVSAVSSFLLIPDFLPGTEYSFTQSKLMSRSITLLGIFVRLWVLFQGGCNILRSPFQLTCALFFYLALCYLRMRFHAQFPVWERQWS